MRWHAIMNFGTTLAVVVILSASGPNALGEEKRATKAITVETVGYKGWTHNVKLSNGDVELIITLDVGPRIISYRLIDGVNVFMNYEKMLGKSGETEWMNRGGHRLWVAPEEPARTYAPDNGPVAYKEIGPGGLRFTPAPESAFGIQKELDVTLAASGSKVEVKHRVKNIGKTDTTLAVWALSVMAPGGMEIIPLPPKAPHPGAAKNAKSAADFAPNLFFSFWPYFDFKDPRLDLGTDFITLSQNSMMSATKFGLTQKTGRVGYLNGGTLFTKAFTFREGVHYPDHGVNYETYTDQDMLEMETLGPITKLAPGESVEHTENWELVGNLEPATTSGQIKERISPHLK